jgi:hypothetical protein
MILRVYRDAGNRAEDPVILERLRPQRLHLVTGAAGRAAALGVCGLLHGRQTDRDAGGTGDG